MAKLAVKTYISDSADSTNKCKLVRNLAKTNPVLALKMANAISNNVSLLSGLTAVVAALTNHDQALNVLKEVFNRPGVKSKYKSEFAVVCKAELNSLFN